MWTHLQCSLALMISERHPFIRYSDSELSHLFVWQPLGWFAWMILGHGRNSECKSPKIDFIFRITHHIVWINEQNKGHRSFSQFICGGHKFENSSTYTCTSYEFFEGRALRFSGPVEMLNSFFSFIESVSGFSCDDEQNCYWRAIAV